MAQSAWMNVLMRGDVHHAGNARPDCGKRVTLAPCSGIQEILTILARRD